MIDSERERLVTVEEKVTRLEEGIVSLSGQVYAAGEVTKGLSSIISNIEDRIVKLELPSRADPIPSDLLDD